MQSRLYSGVNSILCGLYNLNNGFVDFTCSVINVLNYFVESVAPSSIPILKNTARSYALVTHVGNP